MSATKTPVEVEGKALTLSNLDKVLYPAVALTKRDVLRYYTAIGPVLLPHLAGRPVTFKRAPTAWREVPSSRSTSRAARPGGSRPSRSPPKTSRARRQR